MACCPECLGDHKETNVCPHRCNPGACRVLCRKADRCCHASVANVIWMHCFTRIEHFIGARGRFASFLKGVGSLRLSSKMSAVGRLANLTRQARAALRQPGLSLLSACTSHMTPWLNSSILNIHFTQTRYLSLHGIC